MAFYVLNFEQESGESSTISWPRPRRTHAQSMHRLHTWLKFASCWSMPPHRASWWPRPLRPLAPNRRWEVALVAPRSGQGPILCALGIDRKVLPRLCFPVASTRSPKSADCGRFGTPRGREADSQEICFVPTRTTPASSANAATPRYAGEIVTTDGTVVGRHAAGKFHHRPAQGLAIAFGEPRYVVRLEPASRRVVVGTRDELARDSLPPAGEWLAEGVSDGRVR